MRKKGVVLFAVSIATSLTGCANLNSVYRTLDLNEGKGALVDVKQRAIIVARKGSETLVCAEPSPDALSAYAAELAAKADVYGTVNAAATSAFQESSSFVGLRTQSIQLLRDASYRICEGYMSGALDKARYEMLMRRYQKYMVALLAIEQITGTLRAPNVTINTQGTAEAAKSLEEMQSQIEKLNKEISSLSNDKAGKGTEEVAKIEEQIAAREKNKGALNAGIQNARGLITTGSATATVSNIGLPVSRSADEVNTVSYVVGSIVGTILNSDDMGQVCWSYLSDPQVKNSSLEESCTNFINGTIENKQVYYETLKAKQEQINLALVLYRDEKIDKDEMKRILASSTSEPPPFAMMVKPVAMPVAMRKAPAVMEPVAMPVVMQEEPAVMEMAMEPAAMPEKPVAMPVEPAPGVIKRPRAQK